MNNNQNQYVRRYRKKNESGAGATVAIVILSVVIVLALLVLVLALTGKLSPLLGVLLGKDETTPQKTETSAPTETTGPADTETAAGTETASVTETGAQTGGPEESGAPVTNPPAIEGEITWDFLSLEYKDTEKGILVLVDTDHPYTFPEKNTNVNVYGLKGRKYSLANSSVELDETAAKRFTDLAQAFFEATGHSDLMVSGAYRTYEYQDQLYQSYGAGRTFAPGCSDYHVGTSLYVKVFDKDGDGITRELDALKGDYEWVMDHAHEYGFVMRYPENKTEFTGTVTDGQGHYRYVGVAHATLMKQKNLCFEEYLDYLQDFTYTGNHLTVSTAEGGFEIFYVPLMADGVTKVPVPNNFPYTISGDNDGGVIVTIHR